MKPITNSIDLAEFANKVIAWRWEQDGEISYAHVSKTMSQWTFGGLGYNLSFLKAPDKVAHNNAITQQLIDRYAGLSARLLMPDDKRRIKDLLASGYRFEYCESLMPYLISQLDK